MNERQEVLTLVGEFLTGFYRQTPNYEKATKNARGNAGQHPQYKSELSNAFQYLLTDSFSPDTFLTRARSEANYYAIDEVDARDFLADVYIDINKNHELNQSQLDIPQLIADLHSLDTKSRSQAAEILACCCDERLIKPLIATLKNHANPQVRWTAIYVLRQLGDLQVVEPLITLLKDDAESDIRGVAAYTLGQLGDKRAIQPLIAAFSDETNGVRYSATQALAQFGACTVEPLLLFLKREDKHSNAVSQVFLLMNDNEAI
jgi:hypothetical protein